MNGIKYLLCSACYQCEYVQELNRQVSLSVLVAHRIVHVDCGYLLLLL